MRQAEQVSGVLVRVDESISDVRLLALDVRREEPEYAALNVPVQTRFKTAVAVPVRHDALVERVQEHSVEYERDEAAALQLLRLPPLLRAIRR